jgi:hypothetical protein
MIEITLATPEKRGDLTKARIESKGSIDFTTGEVLAFWGRYGDDDDPTESRTLHVVLPADDLKALVVALIKVGQTAGGLPAGTLNILAKM